MQNALAILVALLGSLLMAIGTQMQSSGVRDSGRATAAVRSGGFTLAQLFPLLRSKRWVFGTLLLGLAILVQLSALGLAPLMVVQPVGVLGLVITTALNARLHHVTPSRSLVTGVMMCVAGVGIFLVLTTLYAEDQEVSDARLLITCGVFVVVVGIVLATLRLLNRRGGALGYIVGTGVLYGFVSTFAKILLARWQNGTLDAHALLPAVLLLLAVGLGMWFVQNAHASGPPDLVMAGLTVIDPIVGVLIGMTILGEAVGIPLWVLPFLIASGLLAVLGVFRIARAHPQNQAGAARRESEVPAQPGDSGTGADDR
jgi:drug/metabolite transporter (DMT)-like permease